MENIPIIRAVLSRDGKKQYFLCKYCRKRHFHGIGNGHFPGKENCPYKKTGYWLTNSDCYIG